MTIHVVSAGQQGPQGVQGPEGLPGSSTSVQEFTNKTVNSATNNIHADVVHLLVRNVSGSTIPTMSPVYVSGWNAGQGVAEVSLADAAGLHPAIGLVESSMANNTNGQCVVSGTMVGVDTSAWSVGDSLYLHTIAGTLSNIRPAGYDTSVQKIASVLRSNASLGVVLIQGAGRSNDTPNQWPQSMDAAGHSLLGLGCVALLPGVGLKVGDAVSSTYGWKDLIGDLTPKTSGVGAPTISVFRGGQVRFYTYASGDDLDITYHIPHDYVMGSDIFIHTHWAHNGTAISGSFVADFFHSYAKGHNQSNFPAEKQVTMSVSTPNIATVPQYRQRVDEVQLSIAGGSATLMDTALLEPDGVLGVHFDATTIPVITGGSPNRPFLMAVDIHYQSTEATTKNKSFPFNT